DAAHRLIEPSISECVVRLAAHAGVAQHGGNHVQGLQVAERHHAQQIVEAPRLDANAFQELLQRLVAEQARYRDTSTMKHRREWTKPLHGLGSRALDRREVGYIRLQIDMGYPLAPK